MPLTYCSGCKTTIRRLLNVVPEMLCPSCLVRGDHVPLRFASLDAPGSPPLWRSRPTRRDADQVTVRGDCAGSLRRLAGGSDG